MAVTKSRARAAVRISDEFEFQSNTEPDHGYVRVARASHWALDDAMDANSAHNLSANRQLIREGSAAVRDDNLDNRLEYGE